jgi:hypothetical protein
MAGWKGAWVGLLLGVLGSWPTEAHAGRLDSVRSEVSGSRSSSSDSSSSSSDSNDSSSDSSDSDGSGCCTFGSGSATGVGPSLLSPKSARFRHYPYEGDTSDYLFAARPQDPRTRRWAGQAWSEGAWQGRGLWRTAGGLRIDTSVIGFDGDLSYYLEPAANDALYLGTANLSLIPFRGPHGLFRVGGGINTMIDGRVPGEGHREYALGWNVTTSLDLFPAWPVVISARADVGQLYQAVMARGRASVGVMLWRMEIFGGYEHTQVGRVALAGPMLGIRLWL